jgi:carboxymethylenebutenolidase
MGQTIRYQSAAGDTDAYLAPARPSPGPPVLLLHAWWGLTDMIRDLADRLAADGFTVLAPDLFDGTVLTTIEDATAHQQRIEADDVSADRLLGRVTAALDHLLAHPDVHGDRAGVVAFSFGAWYAAQMAAARPEVVALVNYYGGIGGDLPDGPEGGTRPSYLAHAAENDPYEDDPAAVHRLVARLQEKDSSSAAHLYPGTSHWFAEPDRPEYNAEAAELAYKRTVDFLGANLRSGSG